MSRAVELDVAADEAQRGSLVAADQVVGGGEATVGRDLHLGQLRLEIGEGLVDEGLACGFCLGVPEIEPG